VAAEAARPSEAAGATESLGAHSVVPMMFVHIAIVTDIS
jgi:hypothetical protein